MSAMVVTVLVGRRAMRNLQIESLQIRHSEVDWSRYMPCLYSTQQSFAEHGILSRRAICKTQNLKADDLVTS